jgi:glucose-1-phosphate thymidylyltransferase
MKAIIPTGGRGTRMQPITFSANKHFIPIANKPLIYYPIETVADAGIKNIAITYNPGWLELVKSHLGTGSKWGLNFTYVLQEKPLGLANIVEVCEEFVGKDRFVLHLGDNIFTKGIADAVKYFNDKKPDGLVYRLHHPENKRLGVPYFNKQNRLIKYVEKPKNPPHDFAVPGIYFLTQKAFQCFRGKDKIKPSDRGEFEIPSVFEWLIKHKYKVDVLEYTGRWLDPGKFGDWIESNQYLLDTTLESNYQTNLKKKILVEGRVNVGKKANIINSQIRGPVAIGDNVTIKDSYIGPYTSISDNCEITSSHVENSVLMQSVKINSIQKPIDNSLIGSGSEIVDDKKVVNKLELFV